jgi:hypothetical protein
VYACDAYCTANLVSTVQSCISTGGSRDSCGNLLGSDLDPRLPAQGDGSCPGGFRGNDLHQRVDMRVSWHASSALRRYTRIGMSAHVFVAASTRSVMPYQGGNLDYIKTRIDSYVEFVTCQLSFRSHSNDSSFMHSDVSLFYTYTVVAELYFVVVTVSLVSLFMP